MLEYDGQSTCKINKNSTFLKHLSRNINLGVTLYNSQTNNSAVYLTSWFSVVLVRLNP